MLPRPHLLSSAVLTGLLLAAPQAEARFGKSSQPAESSSSSTSESTRSSDSNTHDASPVQDSSSVHDASPVGEDSPRPHRPRPDAPRDEDVSSERPRRESRRRHGSSYGTYYTDPSAPLYYDDGTPPEVVQDTSEYGQAKNFLFGMDLQVVPGGRSAGLHMGVEFDRWGGMLRAGALSLRPDDGGLAEDTIRLLTAHMTWAPLANRIGRVRLEAGLAVAQAPDVTFVGPSMGTSAELYLSRSVSFEARVQFTPVPHRQLDTAGGIVVYVFEDMFAVRGGMRMLVLNDAGKVDGVVHEDVLPGPYISFGMAI